MITQLTQFTCSPRSAPPPPSQLLLQSLCQVVTTEIIGNRLVLDHQSSTHRVLVPEVTPHPCHFVGKRRREWHTHISPHTQKYFTM